MRGKLEQVQRVAVSGRTDLSSDDRRIRTGHCSYPKSSRRRAVAQGSCLRLAGADKAVAGA